MAGPGVAHKTNGRIAYQDLIDLTASSDDEPGRPHKARRPLGVTKAEMTTVQVQPAGRLDSLSGSNAFRPTRELHQKPTGASNGRTLQLKASEAPKNAKQLRLADSDILAEIDVDSSDDDNINAGIPAGSIHDSIACQPDFKFPTLKIPAIPKFEDSSWPIFKKTKAAIAQSPISSPLSSSASPSTPISKIISSTPQEKLVQKAVRSSSSFSTSTAPSLAIQQDQSQNVTTVQTVQQKTTSHSSRDKTKELANGHVATSSAAEQVAESNLLSRKRPHNQEDHNGDSHSVYSSKRTALTSGQPVYPWSTGSQNSSQIVPASSLSKKSATLDCTPARLGLQSSSVRTDDYFAPSLTLRTSPSGRQSRMHDSQSVQSPESGKQPRPHHDTVSQAPSASAQSVVQTSAVSDCQKVLNAFNYKQQQFRTSLFRGSHNHNAHISSLAGLHNARQPTRDVHSKHRQRRLGSASITDGAVVVHRSSVALATTNTGNAQVSAPLRDQAAMNVTDSDHAAPASAQMMPKHLVIAMDNMSDTTRMLFSNAMAIKGGRASWTLAERVMLVYFREEFAKGLDKFAIDYLFGRNYGGSCSTTYARWHADRKPESRSKLNLASNLPALRQIMTWNLSLDGVRAALQQFIDERRLPDSIASFEPSRDASKAPDMAAIIARNHADHNQPKDLKLRDSPADTLDEDITLLRRAHHRSKNVTDYAPMSRAASRSSSVTVESLEHLVTAPNAVTQFFNQPHSAGHYSSKFCTYPYLSRTERSLAQEAVDNIAWTREECAAATEAGFQDLHVPISGHEAKLVAQFLAKQFDVVLSEDDTTSSTFIRHVVNSLGTGNLRLHELSDGIASRVLISRTTRSVLSYLKDLSEPCSDSVTLLQSRRAEVKTAQRLSHVMGSRIHTRAVCKSGSFKHDLLSTIGPAKAYTYMSGDVSTIAFASNSNTFLVGSVCDQSPEYNYPGNFLLGDVASNKVHTLDYHWKPAANDESSAVSRIFYTVAMADFSLDGRSFYSAGYDGVARAYSTNNSEQADIAYLDDQTSVVLLDQLSLGAPVDLLRVSKTHGLLAMGAQSNSAPISVMRHRSNARFDAPAILPFDGKMDVHPSCLQWAPSYASQLLLGGFTNPGQDIKHGNLALWDVHSGQKMDIRKSHGFVFDLNWSPHQRLFAAAMRPTAMVNQSKSIIRIFDVRYAGSFDLDCTARDINDVVISPHDENIIAAGTTEGKIFVYDLRNPNNLPMVLAHGRPIDMKTAKDDTGVRFCAWNHSRHGLITGSSDGVVKSWDIYKGKQDAHTEDIATHSSGIYCGAFSSDYTLAIGEVKKAFTIYEPLNKGRPVMDLDDFEIVKGSARDFMSAIAQNEAAACDPMVSAMPLDRACRIPLCYESEALQAGSSLDDSRRWEDRISGALLKMPDGDKTARAQHTQRFVVQAARKCLNCGDVARPSANLNKPLCERCGFSCTRCGRSIELPEQLDCFECLCGGRWTIGALGYELARPPRRANIKISGKDLQPDCDSTSLANDVDDDFYDADDYYIADLYAQLWDLKLWNQHNSSYVGFWSNKKK